MQATTYFQKDKSTRRKEGCSWLKILEIFLEKYLTKILEAEIQPMQRSDLTTAVQVYSLYDAFLVRFNSLLKPAERISAYTGIHISNF